jgi:predicted metal-dependent enzyme (double-stranded beta helix superfamily)
VPIVHHHDVPRETFRTGMTYQTLVGDERGSTPVRVGIQTSAPGSKTPVHSHPYLEVLTVLEGQGDHLRRACFPAPHCQCSRRLERAFLAIARKLVFFVTVLSRGEVR